MMRRHRALGGFALGLVCGIAVACSDGENSGDVGSCAGGVAIVCACPGGGEGVQACTPEGEALGPCECGDDDASGETEPAQTAEGDATCGDGVEDPGECPAACPQDCAATNDPSVGGVVVVASVPLQPSRWQSGPFIGFEAGQDLCRRAAASMGVPRPLEVTVCDYEQVLQAEAAGELAPLAGTTAWVHRTTVAKIDGVKSAPGPGGRCADWTYSTNHLSDGEHMEIGAGGAATYFLDNDTFYDGIDASHAQPGALECGTESRSILCCAPP
jgi:hypothetical protein